MPAIDCEIQHGLLPDIDFYDEPGILMQSLNISPSREKREFRGSDGCFKGLRYRNPLMTLRFSGFISSLAVLNPENLANKHPGTAIASLANYAADRYGFTPTDGVTVYEDPSADLSAEDDPQCQFTAVQYPFVA